MSFSEEMLKICDMLKLRGHLVTIPKFTEKYVLLSDMDMAHAESVKNKMEYDLIKGYFDAIKISDAILVINKTKNGVENYVGGNTLMEMGFAHVLGKQIFMLNSIPKMQYTDEIVAMKPKIIGTELIF